MTATLTSPGGILPLLRALQSLALATGDVPGVETWSTERLEEVARRGLASARAFPGPL